MSPIIKSVIQFDSYYDTANATRLEWKLDPFVNYSVLKNNPATLYVSVKNVGTKLAEDVRIAPDNLPPGTTFHFYSPGGQLNTPWDIPAGQTSTGAIIAIENQNTVVSPTDIRFSVWGTNAVQPLQLFGENTMNYSAASDAPINPLMSMLYVPTSDRIVHIPGVNGVNVFVASILNWGAAGNVKFTMDSPSPVSMFTCILNASWVCEGTTLPSVEVTRFMAAQENVLVYVAVFGQGTSIPLDLYNNRVFLRAREANTNIVRGSIGIAITTQ